MVYFPEGQYNIDSLMRVYSNTTLKLDTSAVFLDFVLRNLLKISRIMEAI